MEDIDAPRCSAVHASSILRTLEAHGFTWDGPIVFQSQRLELYREQLARLEQAGAVYSCSCTRHQLEHLPRNANHEVVYPGLCRGGMRNPLARQHATRLRVSNVEVCFNDLHFGARTEHVARESGDFVLFRADGYFAYHFVVVVDDFLQGVTNIVRGSDLLFATARQEFLRQQLGFSPVRHLHVPIATNFKGEKLSKQTCAPALVDSRASANLVAALSALGQAPQKDLERESPRVVLAWAMAHWSRSRIANALSFVADGNEK